MIQRILILVVIAAACAGPAFAGASSGGVRPPAPDSLVLTGNPYVDLLGLERMRVTPMQDSLEKNLGEPARKSVWLASGLSIVLPGAGQFYAKSYWKSALFLAIEATAWTLAAVYDGKGDEKTDFFEGLADQNWSVVRYGQYTEQHLTGGRTFNWLVSNDAALPPWDRVDWGELNNMERAFSAQPGGGFYSHTLPRRPEQQYYELIGKYTQYNQGWNDADPTLPPDYSVLNANLTPTFLHYSQLRGEANDYYSVAKTFVTVAIVNHVISAIDAALTASSYNRNLHAEALIRTFPAPGGFTQVPALKLHYNF